VLRPPVHVAHILKQARHDPAESYVPSLQTQLGGVILPVAQVEQFVDVVKQVVHLTSQIFLINIKNIFYAASVGSRIKIASIACTNS
jgi:hypothetical protein